MSNDRVEIRIETIGDPKGAETVSRGVEQVGDSIQHAGAVAERASQAIDTVAESVAETTRLVPAFAEEWQDLAEAIEGTAPAAETMAEETVVAVEAIADAAIEAKEEVEDLADVASGKTGPIGSFLDRHFPTFQKWGGAIGEMRQGLGKLGTQLGGFPGLILQGLANPWATAATVAAGALAAIGKAVMDVQRRIEESARRHNQSWEEMGLYTETYAEKAGAALSNAGASATYYAGVLARIAGALREEITALGERETMIDQRLRDDKRLADSATRLAKARIDAAVAEGRLDRETAEQQKAGLEMGAAQGDFEREKKAAEAKAAERAKAAAKAGQLAAEAERLAAEAEARAKEFEGMPWARRADETDPKLREREMVALSRRGRAAIESEDPGQIARAEAAGKAANEVAPAWKSAIPIYGIYNSVKAVSEVISVWTETTESIEEAGKRLIESEAELKQAIAAKDAAIAAEQEARRKAAEDARTQAEDAKREAERLAKAASDAKGDAGAYAPGGVEDQLRRDRQEMDRLAGGGAAYLPPIDPASLGGIAPSAEADRFLQAISDGIEQREVAFLDRLLATLLKQNGGNNQVEARLRQIEAQMAQIRAGGRQ